MNAPATRHRPRNVPNSAPERRLRETVPGIANICMKTYTIVQPTRVATCATIATLCGL